MALSAKAKLAAEKLAIDAYLDAISDTELQQKMGEAYAELNTVSIEAPNSEWHESCFAAVIAFSQEIQKRALRKSSGASNTEVFH